MPHFPEEQPDMTILNRTALLEAKTLSLKINEKSITVQYNVLDGEKAIGDVWLTFTPSDKLVNILKSEIQKAINNK